MTTDNPKPPEKIPDVTEASSEAPCSDTTALRIQMHQLEMSICYGGPSDICGSIDAVESALNDLRKIVCPNAPDEPPRNHDER
jgi:hypothetical protein